MKKAVSILLSVLMLLSLCFTMGGCEKESDALIGTWTALVDESKILQDSFRVGLGENADEILEHFVFNNYTVVYVITFRADGTYMQYVTESSAKALIPKVRDDLTRGLSSYFMEFFKNQGYAGSVSEILQQLTGKTLAETVDPIIEQVEKELENSLKTQEGCFRAEDGKLYLSTDTKTKPKDDSYDTYTVDTDTLTLHECFCQVDEALKEYNDMLYPIVFERRN